MLSKQNTEGIKENFLILFENTVSESQRNDMSVNWSFDDILAAVQFSRIDLRSIVKIYASNCVTHIGQRIDIVLSITLNVFGIVSVNVVCM